VVALRNVNLDSSCFKVQEGNKVEDDLMAANLHFIMVGILEEEEIIDQIMEVEIILTYEEEDITLNLEGINQVINVEIA